MITLELSKEDLALIKRLLSREEAATRIQVHHARYAFDYRDYLKAREKDIHDLLERLNNISLD